MSISKCSTALFCKETKMHEVSKALHRYATETDHSTTTTTSASQHHSQPIHAQDNDTRMAYLDALRTPVQMQAFLNTEALRLTSAFEEYDGTLTCTPVHTRIECLDDHGNVLRTCTTCIDANTKFTCIGRKGDVCTPAFACHVSRYHVLVAHVTFAAEGMPTSRYLVFIDYWSHGGTAFAQSQQSQQSQNSATPTTHASLPNARCVLMTRVTPATPITLLLGNLSLSDEHVYALNAFAPPLQVRFTVDEERDITAQPNLSTCVADMRTCVICMDAPRTEVFTACNHLVTCRACCQILLEQKQGCPLCKQHVTGVRGATKKDTETYCD